MTHKEELIFYRRKRAQETLHDARTLFKESRLYSAVNRIYYTRDVASRRIISNLI